MFIICHIDFTQKPSQVGETTVKIYSVFGPCAPERILSLNMTFCFHVVRLLSFAVTYRCGKANMFVATVTSYYQCTIHGFAVCGENFQSARKYILKIILCPKVGVVTSNYKVLKRGPKKKKKKQTHVTLLHFFSFS